MRKEILCVIFFAASLFCQAQSNEIERLKKQISEHPQQDTFRVNRLLEICRTAPTVPIEEYEKYAAEALSLSRKLKYTLGEGYALLSNSRANSVRRNHEAALTLVRQADSIAKVLGDQTLLYWVFSRYSGYYVNSDIRLSLSWDLKSEELALQLGDKDLIARSQIAIAGDYINLGDYALAMEYSIKGLRIAEELNSPIHLYNAYDNMGYIYSLIGEYDKSNTYYQKQPDLSKQLGFESRGLANLYISLGENYRLAKEYPRAIEYYNKGLAVTNSPSDSAIIFSNLGDVYVSLDSLSLAFHYAFKSLAAIKKISISQFEPWVDGILARAYLKRNMPDSALYHADKGYKSAYQSGIMEFMLDNSMALAEAYKLKNDFKNAYNYHNLYISFRDSITGAAVKNKTTVLEHNYEMEKKEDQIELLSQQKKAQRSFLVSVSIILGLIVVSAIGMLRSIRQKQKANKLLQQQKLEIDEKARELSVQKDNLEKSYNNVELLGEIGRKITSSLSVDKIMATVYDNVNALMDASIFGIGIYHEDTKTIDFPATFENGQVLPAYSNSIYDQNRFAGLCFISGKEIVINDLSKEYSNYLQQLPTPVEGNQPASLIYLPLKVKEKMFGVITVQSFKKNAFTDYHLYMLRTIAIYAAIALENAESYKKLTETVTSLQETQKQLIQSEKMASLGELTAGIAHEIQNPLNFVNNFSEVNSELISELKEEINNGNLNEVRLIADNINENEQKILFHGKRADAIVKSMLQHSRASTGRKELTDINVLADEYLRLAYHGLRAKDKSFNAKFETHFDEAVGLVNVMPQEIGRVILNLINNAFYAVSEKARHQHNGYQPAVAVSTKKTNGNMELNITDNGDGIPQKVLDKIFQPFFTTKPAGEGTGLGLSLSYEIVKAHGGELNVETKEGEGTTFIISIPTHN